MPINRGPWQVRLVLLPAQLQIRSRGGVDPAVLLVDPVLDYPQHVRLDSFAKRGPDEVFDPISTRRGLLSLPSL